MDDAWVRELGDEGTIPPQLDWSGHQPMDGAELEEHYRHILAELGRAFGLIPAIFRKAKNRIEVQPTPRQASPPVLTHLLSCCCREADVCLDDSVLIIRTVWLYPFPQIVL